MDRWLETMVMGGLRVTLWVCVAILALGVFLFLTLVGLFVGAALLGEVGGILFALVFGVGGTAGIGFGLYRLGKNFW